MKLVHPEWKHQIEFQEEKVPLLIIESSTLLCEYLEELNNQCNGVEGRFILSDNNDELPIEKIAFIEINLFEMDINSKRILSKLYVELKNIAMDEVLYMDTCQIISELGAYIEKIADETDYMITYEQEIDQTGILKLCNVKLQTQYTSMLEKIVDYIDVMQKICHMKLAIFVNLKSYLSEEEFEKLYTMIRYRKMNLLLIENREPEKLLVTEKKFIIDKTGCEIY